MCFFFTKKLIFDFQLVFFFLYRTQKKKRLIPPGKPSTKKKKKKKVVSGLEKSSKDEKSSPRSTGTADQPDAPDNLEGERTIRKSTRTAVIVRQAERDAIRAALQATARVSSFILLFPIASDTFDDLWNSLYFIG